MYLAAFVTLVFNRADDVICIIDVSMYLTEHSSGVSLMMYLTEHSSGGGDADDVICIIDDDDSNDGVETCAADKCLKPSGNPNPSQVTPVSLYILK